MSQMPSVVRTMRDRGLPPEPPAENPHEVARTKWDDLREYAVKVAEVARETDDVNKMLQADNDALRREVERLAASNVQLARENRTVSAYAQSLRTRLTGMREQIEAAEREALEQAGAAREPKAEPPPRQIETATVDRERIRRQLSAAGTVVPENSWPAAAAH